MKPPGSPESCEHIDFSQLPTLQFLICITAGEFKLRSASHIPRSKKLMEQWKKKCVIIGNGDFALYNLTDAWP